MNKPLLVSVVGPTAVGKTNFAIQLASHFGSEILSADSRQFYKEMAIGTAKPTETELMVVKHHFINSHSIQEYYSAGRFERDALKLMEEKGKSLSVMFAVGGSGLFFKALWQGLDEMPEVDSSIRETLNASYEKDGLPPLLEELRNQDPDYHDLVDRQNHQRVIRALEVIRASGKPFSSFRTNTSKAKERDFDILKIGLTMDREILFERINHRMDMMIDEGLFEEARGLINYRNCNALQTVGYTEIFDYFDGKYDKDEAVRLLKRNSRRYAKRQLTWFKKDPEITWLEPTQLDQAIKLIESKLPN